MRHFTREDGKLVYEFEESEQELSDRFMVAIQDFDAKRYVVDRMLEGLTKAMFQDLANGVIGEGSEKSSDVVHTAIESIASFVKKTEAEGHKAWKPLYDAGLPANGKGWHYNKYTHQFITKPDE